MEPRIVPCIDPYTTVGWLTMPYTYSVGILGDKFFTELRDNKRIIGVRCPECNLVIVPPRSVCARCYGKLEEVVQVQTKGTLLTYTVVHYASPAHVLPHPFAYGIIQLDGASTGFSHFLGEVDLDEIKAGMKVEAVFKEERQGNILDIKYFKRITK